MPRSPVRLTVGPLSLLSGPTADMFVGSTTIVSFVVRQIDRLASSWQFAFQNVQCVETAAISAELACGLLTMRNDDLP